MAGHRNKDYFCALGGRSHGEVFFIPRVLPPFCVPVPCFIWLAAHLTDPPLDMRQFGKEIQRSTQGTTGNLNLQSEVTIGSLNLQSEVTIGSLNLQSGVVIYTTG